MEHRSPATLAPAPAPGPLPPGRLVFEQVAAAMVADGLVAPSDLERIRFSGQGARNASEVHPLVLLANLKLVAASGGELGLERLTEWLATRTGTRYLRIDPTRVDVAAVTALVSHAYARRHRFLPLAVDTERLLVATSEPLAQEWLLDLQHLARRRIELAMVNPLDLHRYTMEFYGVTRSVRGARGDVRSEASGTLPSFEQLVELGRSGDVNADDQHVVHIVDWLLQYAFEQRASDIHLEPRRDMGRMRFRIDGVLHKVFEVPPPVMTAMVSRIKVLGRMDLAERRRPQDGRIKTRSPGGREVEMRLSTMPTAFGEKCVMRIFDPDAAFKSIDQLGFSPQEAAGWTALVERPHGIVLVTGPTGSGKTTTLYSTLKRLATPDVNVCTVEDPIEMIAPEFNQMQVQTNIDLDFAAGVRTLLRQDPDIIMIGEIRDLETAQMAVQASLTGHLVLSTLHTNDAPSAITRLLDLGVPHYLLASTINGVLAQRLVRTLCPHCKVPRPLSAVQWAALADADEALPESPTPYAPAGCLDCRRTGYMGRVGLYELLPLTSRLRGLIRADMDLAGFSRAARAEGVRTLRRAGLEKVAAGLTTIEEVLSVLPPPDEPLALPDS
ncbi:GspE/PulE family protein [Stenotrophomonas sp. NPDC047960]|uniref:GspE/PulE family protein n=1 Tax=Stenotrophomonas sp. NPDC047960 TaxID=3364531 RepID=UPI00371357C4